PKVVIKSSSNTKKVPVFLLALFRAFSGKLIAGGLLKVISDVLQLSSPIILKLILDFFNDPSKPTWMGIFYAFLLGANGFCQTLFLQAYFQRQFTIGMRFRAAATGLVYRKSLKLSNSSKQTTTTGEIVNLMSIDASRFGDLCNAKQMKLKDQRIKTMNEVLNGIK
ncbi:unnamed protein product, partial [Didymodactylos carnosus]